jgi:hypothetical protein
VVFIPAPEVIVERGPPLFIDPEELIYHNHPTLRHRVLIKVIEVVDWHEPPDSSNDDNPFGPWPKKIRFSELQHDSCEDPHLGQGSGSGDSGRGGLH